MNKLIQKLAINPIEWAQLWQEAFLQANNVALKRKLLLYSHSNLFNPSQWQTILTTIRQQISVLLPTINAKMYLFAFGEATTGYKASFGLAVAAILAATGQKVVITGEKSYSNQSNIADILPIKLLNCAKTPATFSQRLTNHQVAYLNPADWVTGWQDWDILRVEWPQERVFNQLQPLIFADMSPIFALDNWATARFYQSLGINGNYLYDKSGTGWISLRHDWQWVNATGTNNYSINEQPFLSQEVSFFSQQAEKQTATEAFSHLRRLLSNEISTQERDLLLVNAAFLAMQMSERWNWTGAIAEAEAALSSGRAQIAIS